jgi:hypothetical protein
MAVMPSGKGDHLGAPTVSLRTCVGMIDLPYLSPQVPLRLPSQQFLTCLFRGAYYVKNNFNGGTETFA